jgi:transposase
LGFGDQLYKWKDQISRRGEKAFPGHGCRSASSDEATRLRQELERVKEERDILKKAAAYFAKELK